MAAPKKPKRKRRLPPPHLRCVGVIKSGARCKRKKLGDSDYCHFCNPSVKGDAQRKGAATTRDRKAEIDQAVDALPLLQPVQQAKFLNWLIQQELELKLNRPIKSKNTVRWSLITTWTAQLRNVTQDVKLGRIVRHRRVINMQRHPDAQLTDSAESDTREPRRLPPARKTTEGKSDERD